MSLECRTGWRLEFLALLVVGVEKVLLDDTNIWAVMSLVLRSYTLTHTFLPFLRSDDIRRPSISQLLKTEM